MVISRTMVRHYLTIATLDWLDDHDAPARTTDEWAEVARAAAAAARDAGDLPYLSTALEHLQLHPEVDTAEWVACPYPLADGAVRELIRAMWLAADPESNARSPDLSPSDLPEMSWPEWQRWKLRGLADRGGSARG